MPSASQRRLDSCPRSLATWSGRELESRPPSLVTTRNATSLAAPPASTLKSASMTRTPRSRDPGAAPTRTTSPCRTTTPTSEPEGTEASRPRAVRSSSVRPPSCHATPRAPVAPEDAPHHISIIQIRLERLLRLVVAKILHNHILTLVLPADFVSLAGDQFLPSHEGARKAVTDDGQGKTTAEKRVVGIKEHSQHLQRGRHGAVLSV